MQDNKKGGKKEEEKLRNDERERRKKRTVKERVDTGWNGVLLPDQEIKDIFRERQITKTPYYVAPKYMHFLRRPFRSEVARTAFVRELPYPFSAR